MLRMLGHEISARRRGDIIRQVFITKSFDLASRVEDYYVKLERSLELDSEGSRPSRRSATSNSNKGSMDLRGNQSVIKFGDLQSDHFPLFLTFDQVGFTVT